MITLSWKVFHCPVKSFATPDLDIFKANLGVLKGRKKISGALSPLGPPVHTFLATLAVTGPRSTSVLFSVLVLQGSPEMESPLKES